ncbi:MAG: NAD(P)-binding domain-containing protein [Ignavibacteriaceae bacterium]|jgi:pyrroline-5-carboxylate reductase
MKNKTIGFIGGGRATNIFLQAFKKANASFDKIVVFDPDTKSLKKLNNNYIQVECENYDIESAARSDFVILAVHPPVILEILTKIGHLLKSDAIVISLAPKITIQKITQELNGFQNIARVNPSATGIINKGINPVAFADSLSDSLKKDILDLLHILGKVPIVEESKIEAYAVICAMGPTYFWFQLQQLKMIAISFGMDEKEAEEMITEMSIGTVRTLFNSNMTPEEVMDLVPVKPLGEHEEMIKSFYIEKLNAIYKKIKP